MYLDHICIPVLVCQNFKLTFTATYSNKLAQLWKCCIRSFISPGRAHILMDFDWIKEAETAVKEFC